LEVNSTITSLSDIYYGTNLSKHLNTLIEENKAIYALNHIFLEEIKIKELEKILPDEFILIEDFFKVDDEHVIKISKENSKKQSHQQMNTQKKSQKPMNIQQKKQQQQKILQQKKKVVNKIFQSFKEYLEVKLEFWQFWQVYDIEKKKELLIPRKILLQFLQNGDLFFTFKNRDLQRRVIKKLERIVSLEYSNVFDELKEIYNPLLPIDVTDTEKRSTQQNMDIQVQKTSTSSSNKQSQIEVGKTKQQSYQHYEKLLFDTYRDQILKRFVEINNKKIENLQKQLQSKKTQIQTQMQIKKQIEKKQEQLLKLRQKLEEKQSKRDQNKLIEYKQQKKQLIEIKNLVKINETVSKMNKIEENILFYMLPDTVIFKYFDERNLGKAKDRKRKSYQLVKSTQQQIQNPNKKIKSNKIYRIISQSSNGDARIQYRNTNGSLKRDYLTRAEIKQLQKKGYTEV